MSEYSMVKVSIIIPVHNVSEYIERCIESVLSQTYHNIECIIVDDATPDDSIEKCKGLILAYKGSVSFKFVNHAENRGLSAARNTGVKAAAGDYVYFLDGDDEIKPDSIEKLVTPIIEDNTIDIVQGNYVSCPIEKGDGREWIENSIVGNDNIRDMFFNGKSLPVTAWNKLVCREFILANNLFFEEGLLFEDILWSFCMMKYVEKLYLVSDVTYIYYKRDDSIKSSTKLSIAISNYGRIYRHIAENLSPGCEYMEVHHYLKGFCLMYVEGVENENFKYAYTNFLEIIKLKGRSFEGLALVFLQIVLNMGWARCLIRKMKRRLYGSFC